MSTHATTRIVGAPVPRKEGVDKLLGRACYVDDIEREGMWHGATVRSSIPRGLIRSIAFDRRIDWSEFTIVTAADIPGENYIQLIVADQPCLADGKVNHCEEPIVLLAHPDKHKLREAVGAVADRVRAAAANLHHRRERAAGCNRLGRRQPAQKLPARKRRCGFRMGPRGAHRRRRVPHRRAGTSLHREPGHDRRVQCGKRRHGLGLAAMPLLRLQIAARGLRSARRKGARDPDRNRRRIRRQRGLPLHHCLPCGFAGHEERPSGEDGLRPDGGSGRDHQAPSLARAASHGARPRRQAAGHGDRSRHRRRRLRDALVHRAFARHAARDRTVSLPQCSRPCALVGDKQRSLRRISRLRRAAGHLRHGAPHGRDRRGPRHRSRGAAAKKLPAPGRHQRDRTIDARADDPRSIARSRAQGERLLRQARAIRPRESRQPRQARHGHRRFLSRLGLYRLGRGVFEFAGRHRRHARRQSPRAGVEHRVRPGHKYRSHADRRGGARRRLQRRHHGRARHRHRAQQRADRGFAHLDGRRPPH